MSSTAEDTERRIRETAYRLWLEAGRPESKAEEHWEQAKLIIATEDGLESSLKPVRQSQAEPIKAVENLGEFPDAKRDQGDQVPYPTPGRPSGDRA